MDKDRFLFHVSRRDIRIVIPTRELIDDVLSFVHGSKLNGHHGIVKTILQSGVFRDLSGRD